MENDCENYCENFSLKGAARKTATAECPPGSVQGMGPAVIEKKVEETQRDQCQ